jgi:hypothetical protein
MLLLASAIIAAGSLSSVSLQLDAPITKVGVGEPVKIVIQWHANRALDSLDIEDADFSRGTLSFWVGDEHGRRHYREFRRSLRDQLHVPGGASSGDTVAVGYVLMRGGYDHNAEPVPALLFSHPGRFTLTAAYSVNGSDVAVSNPIAFVVSPPSNADRAFMAGIGDNWAKVLEAREDELRRLIERYEPAGYLRYVRLLEVRQREERERLTAISASRARGWSEPPSLRQHYVAFLRELEDTQWGPFAEEALALSIDYAEAGGLSEERERLVNAFVRLYPRSGRAAAFRADDETPLSK